MTTTEKKSTEMVKVPTSNLIREGLDWAVAKALFGDRVVHEKTWRQTEDSHFKGSACDWCPDGKFALLTTNWQGTKASDILPYSTDPVHGHPILEREKMDTSVVPATNLRMVEMLVDDKWVRQFGKTLLIAATRCFVASKLGNEIEVPVTLYEAMLRSDPDLHDEQESAAQPAPAANP
jgi:Protein of unknown function (DUF2591)